MAEEAPSTDRFLAGIKPPSPVDLTKDKTSKWELWKQQWGNYVLVSNLNTKSQDYQMAMLLNCIGQDALRIYNSFTFVTGEARDVNTTLEKFDQHIIGTQNVTYERFLFNSLKQNGESFDTFLTNLRHLQKNCQFCACMNDSLVRDRIIMGISDNDLRKALLEIQDLSLAKCIDMCRAHEATSVRMKTLSTDSTPVHVVKKNMKPKRGNFSQCKFCGKKHALKKELCPAYGQTCKSCGRKNHFASVCKGRKQVHTVEEDDGGDTEELMSTVHVNAVDKLIFAKMNICGKTVKFQVDCGASVNAIPVKYVADLKLKPATKKLFGWCGSTVKPLGESKIKLGNPANGKSYCFDFCVVKENLTPILGADACKEMGLITVNNENICSVGNQCDLIEKYAEIFNDEVGILPGEVHLEVDPTVTPVVMPARRIPAALKPKLKNAVDKLVDQKVIAPVNRPTDWVSGLVVATKKSGDLRICIDPRPLNKALKREHFYLPTLDDVLPEMTKARIMSTVDLANGYWHVTLDEESSYLTTFGTPFGRYRWLRLPFGTSVSSELFAKRLYSCVGDLPGVVCVADDLMIFGCGDTDQEAQRDHDIKLEKLFQRCKETGIRLNREKMKIRQSSVTFLGHVISKDGLKPDPEKIKAVQEMPRPSDIEGVRRLNGFVNYLAKFLPRLSDVMEPIRQLTRKNVPWTWSDAQENALKQVKKLVTEAPVLRFYDPAKPLSIQCDSSKTGLGAVLLQDDQPLAFVSRALTDAETRYAQLEKEMLAITWSVEKFHQYTFGRTTHIVSDHKPLESIMKKNLACAPKRLQGMLMRLQKYDIKVTYCPGKHMYLADTLSRAYMPTTEGNVDEFEQVNATQFVSITDSRLEAIRRATDADDSLVTLKSVILEGWPAEKSRVSPLAQPYFSVRDELAIHDGLIFRGERVVIPASQRKILKEKIHSSHLGIDGCLRRARESIFWPNMNAEIREYISGCETCRKFETANPKEPLMSHDIPDRPWAKVGTDLFTFNGREYLLVVDYYSNFWDVDCLFDDATSKVVIRKLKAHFARHGIPDTIVSDNGPQYSSAEFRKFCKSWDIDHVTSSPGNSKANGKAESAVKTAKRMFRKCKDSSSDVYLALLDHRNTPTQGLLSSPAQRLFSRRTKTLLPTASSLLRPEVVDHKHTKRDLKRNQDKQADYYNKHTRELSTLEEGDTVRLQPFKLGQKEWTKGTVLQRLDERSYRIETPTGIVRRNRQHIKPTNAPTPTTTTENLDQNQAENSREDVCRNQNENQTENVTENVKHGSNVGLSPDQPVKTRSGRISKKPDRYNPK